MGPSSIMIKVLTYMLALGIEDDQKALCIYVNNYPEDVALDTKAKVVANITPSILQYIDFQNGRIKNKLTDEYPCFSHTPGKMTDLMIRTNYVGNHVLGNNYQRTPHLVKINTLFKILRTKFKKEYIITIIASLIIIGLLAYYNPKLLYILIIILIAIVFLLLVFYSHGFKYL